MSDYLSEARRPLDRNLCTLPATTGLRKHLHVQAQPCHCGTPGLRLTAKIPTSTLLYRTWFIINLILCHISILLLTQRALPILRTQHTVVKVLFLPLQVLPSSSNSHDIRLHYPVLSMNTYITPNLVCLHTIAPHMGHQNCRPTGTILPSTSRRHLK